MTTWIHAELLKLCVASVIGSACFAVLFRTPRRFFLHTLFVGFVSSVGKNLAPVAWHVSMSAFMVAFAVGSLSNAFARWTKTPAQGFLIPGVIFLVPGASVYHAFSRALEHQVDVAVELLLTAVTVTLGISVGLLVANWVVPSKKIL